MRDSTLNNLYPPFRDIIVKFNDILVTSSIQAFPFETYRSFEQQQEYYKQGRQYANKQWVIVDKKKIVTNARPGFSWHSYGLAIDYAFDGDASKQGIQWSWDKKYPWNKLGEIGKSLGLEWGGTWKSFPETPHFQMTYGFPLHKAYDILINKGLKAFWKELDKHIKG